MRRAQLSAIVVGLAACGGFSYGDVLGAGEGWAKTILFNARAREQFETFFARPDTFTFGSCNGCQMVANLRDIIPGASHWPKFVRNVSEQYEARVALVRIEESPSVLFRGMHGSILPIVVAHGEGQAEFRVDSARESLEAGRGVALRAGGVGYRAHLAVGGDHVADDRNAPLVHRALARHDFRAA